MKKLFVVSVVAVLIAAACGPSAAEKEAQRIADSARIADSIAAVDAEKQRIADSTAAAQAADSVAKAQEANK